MVTRSVLFVLMVAGCATGSSTSSTPAPATIYDEPAPAAASSNQEMQFHFWDVAEARDAVIRADLDAVRGPLQRIADAQYGDDMPPDWRDWIAEMQAQARAGTQVSTLAEAAATVADLSGTCAECHRATNAGPQLSDESVPYHARGEGLPERMQRHMYAAEALWAGLTAPQHQAWSRGARSLKELPLPAVEGEPAPEGEEVSEPSPFTAKLDEIRKLGERADAAAQPTEKSAVYGEILTQCAGCHAQMRGKSL